MALYKCGGDTKYRKLYEQEVSAYNTLNSQYNSLNSQYGYLSSASADAITMKNGSTDDSGADYSFNRKCIALSCEWAFTWGTGNGNKLTYIDASGLSKTVNIDGSGNSDFVVLASSGDKKFIINKNCYTIKNIHYISKWNDTAIVRWI